MFHVSINLLRERDKVPRTVGEGRSGTGNSGGQFNTNIQ